MNEEAKLHANVHLVLVLLVVKGCSLALLKFFQFKFTNICLEQLLRTLKSACFKDSLRLFICMKFGYFIHFYNIPD